MTHLPKRPADGSLDYLEHRMRHEPPDDFQARSSRTPGNSSQYCVKVWAGQEDVPGIVLSELRTDLAAHAGDITNYYSNHTAASRVFSLGASLLALTTQAGQAGRALEGLGYRGYAEHHDNAWRVVLAYPSVAQFNGRLHHVPDAIHLQGIQATDRRGLLKATFDGLRARRQRLLPVPESSALDQARTMIGHASMYGLLPPGIVARIAEKAQAVSSTFHRRPDIRSGFDWQLKGIISPLPHADQLSIGGGLQAAAEGDTQPLGDALSVLVSPPDIHAGRDDDPFAVPPNHAMGQCLARATLQHITHLAQ